MDNKEEEQINNLTTEEILSGTFIVLGLLSIYGDEIQKKYVRTSSEDYEKKANSIFNLILFITIILYLVFLYRSVKSYQKASIRSKDLFGVKLLGGLFFLAGIICTAYFQLNIKTVTEAPEI